MSTKAKKSIGYLVSGVLFIIVGLVTWTVGDIPTGISSLITVVAAIAVALDMIIVVPSIT